MGTADPQPSMFHHANLEQFVTADHPMQKIRPLIDGANPAALRTALCGHRPTLHSAPLPAKQRERFKKTRLSTVCLCNVSRNCSWEPVEPRTEP
jgi:hypothetical protein